MLLPDVSNRRDIKFPDFEASRITYPSKIELDF